MIDLYSLLVSVAAFCGVVAAFYWFKVSSSVDTSGEVVSGPDKRALGMAATMTGFALALASIGYLLGRFWGGF
jgi:hypothetical protein